MKHTTFGFIYIFMIIAIFLSGCLLCFHLSSSKISDSENITVACIGDSITFGSGVFKTRQKDAWPSLLEHRFGKNATVLNYGIRGATLQKEGNRPYKDYVDLDSVMNEKPDLFLVMLGTNDSKPINWNKDRYARQFEELIEKLNRGDWKHQIVLLAPPKAFPNPKTGAILASIDNTVIKNEIHPIVKSTAKKYHLLCIDLYEATKTHPEYYTDGVHPNKKGNRAIARFIYAKISEYNGW